MSKATVKLFVISGSKMLTEFMQSVDMFEKSKVVGIPKEMTVTYEEGQKVTLNRTLPLIDHTKKALEQSGEIVTFIHLVEIQNSNVIIKNNGEVYPYINNEVRCISDGHKWTVLHKFIEANTGLKVITNQHCFITGVGMNLDDKFESIQFKGEELTKNKS